MTYTLTIFKGGGDVDILQQIKILTKSKDDGLVNLLIEKAKVEVLTYCKLDTYTDKLDNVVADIVVEKINRHGTEGLKSQGYSGVSESFNDGYSKNIIEQLERYRKNVRLL